jgi:hypothetical protein
LGLLLGGGKVAGGEFVVWGVVHGGLRVRRAA